jgi:signal transduction histidine kinase
VKKEYELGAALAEHAHDRLPLTTIQFRKKDGSVFPGETNVFFLIDETGAKTGFISLIRDISEKIRLEKNRQTLESQFFQAQKMESVGRLAGGVAHDFNNMLTVILGVSGQALEQLSPQNPLYTDLQDIVAAGERSRDITRQLLAFARKQAISPQLLHLNGTLEDMLKMLRRLIGEDIELSWRPGADLWPVNMDPSQLDQILANLCVNARDAMPGGGKLRIETRNTHLDDPFCAEHIGFLPGDYVELSVSDTGCGMGDDVQAHLFEPFFTTKEVGRGTGLGLATVYGIVHQNHGFIDVKSRVDEGTLITIFLPRSTVSPSSVVSKDAGAMLAGHGETVLVVDDDPLILKVISRVLENLGYVALTAPSPTEAQAIAGRSSSPINLLITDMVMPELNGSELARSLLARFPRLKCMFMSGYTTDVVSRMGDLGQDAAFLHKPFSNRELALKIREILDHNP